MQESVPWNEYQITAADLAAKPTPLNKIASITHIAHRSDAVNILKAGKIQTGLVYDKSKLNQERLPVIWLSPNVWYWGYIYGTVAFHFNWSELITKNTEFYWVEKVASYKPPALRILVCEPGQVDSSVLTKLQKLDPQSLHQPIYFDGKGWWRLDAYTYEFMVPRELKLQQCTKLSFEDHNDTYCNKSTRKSNCKETCKAESAFQLVSLALTNTRPELVRLIKDEDYYCVDYVRKHFCDRLFKELVQRKKSTLTGGDECCIELALIAIGEGYFDQALECLARLDLHTLADFTGERIKETFDIGCAYTKDRLDQTFRRYCKELVDEGGGKTT